MARVVPVSVMTMKPGLWIWTFHCNADFPFDTLLLYGYDINYIHLSFQIGCFIRKERYCQSRVWNRGHRIRFCQMSWHSKSFQDTKWWINMVYNILLDSCCNSLLTAVLWKSKQGVCFELTLKKRKPRFWEAVEWLQMATVRTWFFYTLVLIELNG